MRDYGFGRRDESLESIITAEMKEMVDIRINGPKNSAEQEIVNGELVYMPHFFDVPFLNGILYVLAQCTLPRSEYHRLWTISKGGIKFQRNSDDMGRALSLTPWLKDLFPKWSGFKGLREGNQVFIDFYRDLVQEIMLTQDDAHDRHFLDMYIRKMKQEMQENGRSTFSVDQLLLVCTDYTFPTATAVQMTLTMLVERILYQPGLQERIHEEIDRVVGRDRLPTIDDRNNMPFLEGCLREMMRIEPIVPLGLPHRALKNVQIGGYDVPENTMICINYIHLHMDKDIWGDPENFRPDRYIVDGKLCVAKDKSLPFGAGKRLCAGETYARNSMFLVFATFMQAFRVSTVDGKPLKKLAPRIQGIITTLPEFWIRVTPRNEIAN
ncbi:Probable cytochrome P450 304a1 [Eumeta japonica]|uniref:Probable cytochrome P450 304a1 n=1 Tax=Eumeta variegata TaxID=151549 RepID=A0A4C1VFR7_EUMVA|nr:Probable cytochrome P450 304a1 [Eumeta japonica]